MHWQTAKRYASETSRETVTSAKRLGASTCQSCLVDSARTSWLCPTSGASFLSKATWTRHHVQVLPITSRLISALTLKLGELTLSQCSSVNVSGLSVQYSSNVARRGSSVLCSLMKDRRRRLASASGTLSLQTIVVSLTEFEHVSSLL